MLAGLVLTVVFAKLPTRPLPVVAAIASSQVGLHLLFGLGLSAPDAVVSAQPHAHGGPAMLMSHAAAAVVCTGLVGYGLERLARNVRTLGRLLTRVLLPRAPFAPEHWEWPPRLDPTFAPRGLASRPWSRFLPGRGPPVALAPV